MEQQEKQPFYNILLLILAGEAVFILPFVLARIFRPTVLDVFELTNLELGTCFSIYGIVAFVSYFFGGGIADKFKPKILLAAALFLTALGGLVYASYPSFFVLQLLYGYWGFTTIFLFWAAMIKATRVWGGASKQGRAFGFLDGGRGLVAAGFGSLGVFIFSLFISSEVEGASLMERKEAFRYVILISSGVIVLVALLILAFLKSDDNQQNLKTISNSALIENYKRVIKIPSVWLLMIIIMCAYVGYKSTDYFSQYAKEIMGYNEIEAAQVGTFMLYIRPIIGVVIGFIADKTRAALMMILGFVVMIIGASVFASGALVSGVDTFFFLSIIATATAIYAFRTLYFAAMQEGAIPVAVTGTAVGLISLIGYTPDIFVGPIMGYLLDESPGIQGYQHVFMVLTLFAGLGLLATLCFYKIARKNIH